MVPPSDPSRSLMDTTTTPPAHSPAVPVPAVTERTADQKGIFFIAVFELIKAVLFAVAAAGVFHMVRRDTQVELTKLLHAFRISGDLKFIKALLLKANLITDPAKRVLGYGLLIYAALHATEGTGLLLRKRWAEYITVIMTGIFIPYEIYIIIHRTTHSHVAPYVPSDQQVSAFFGQHILILKIAVLIINVGIVWYLIRHLRRSGHHAHLAPAPPPSDA